jgi:hypothetical protein
LAVRSAQSQSGRFGWAGDYTSSIVISFMNQIVWSAPDEGCPLAYSIEQLTD